MRILALYNFAPHTTANYLVRAFHALGHDVRTAGGAADVRGWANPYRLAGPHDWPLAEGQPLDTGDWRPDLAVWVESGVLDGVAMEGINCPMAAWFIDSLNPRKLEWHQSIAPAFDHIFVAHRGFVEQVNARAHWLPLACDPEIHTPRVLPAEPEYDIAYVGNAYRGDIYQRRFDVLRALARRYRVCAAAGVYFEDMADVYGSAKIGWNMSLTGGDIVMRVFEVMCSGRPLVTDAAPLDALGYAEDLRNLLWPYDSEREMVAGIDWLLDNADRASELGAAGRAAVLAAHTYAHRARQMLEVCGG